MQGTSKPNSLTETASVPNLLTFEEYLFYQDNTDTCYELYRGKLIPMATATVLHTDICKYLIYQFQRHFASTNLVLVATFEKAN
jgi:Uma2 family endonuclease